MQKAVLLVLATFELYNCVYASQCVDHDENPVDWYVVYKLPRQKSDNDLITDGSAYTYMTSDDADNWILSDIPIDSEDSLVGLTLKNLFSKRHFRIFYNDQPREGRPSSKSGHAKGVVLGSNNGGIWLVHTVPRFPSVRKSRYSYPTTGFRNGQNFLCISLDIHQLNKALMRLVPNLTNLTGKKRQYEPYHHPVTLKSIEGSSFMSFAKGSKFGKDLYANLVAPTLEADLLVESWPNTRDRLPSDCTKRYKVYNVASIGIDVADIDFKSTIDHSKWAVVTKNSQNNWICIGDINRGEHQTVRGGGTVCFSRVSVVKAFQRSVTKRESCYDVEISKL